MNASSRTSSSASSSASSSYESLASTLGEDRRELLEQFAHILIAANKGEYGTLTGATTAREALDDHVSDALALLPTFDALLGTGTRVGRRRRRRRRAGAACATSVRGGITGRSARHRATGVEIHAVGFVKEAHDVFRAHRARVGVDQRGRRVGARRGLWAGRRRRESYDVVTARAVAELRVLAEFCVPLVRVGGHWVSAKNADVATEAEDASRAVETLGGGPPLVRVVDASRRTEARERR